MFFEFLKFLVYSAFIVIISKYVLVTTLRKLAENLDLKPKTIGNVAGVATSVPELLTISISSVRGLFGASVYNILSSNVINLVQYLGAVFLNKNQKAFQNKAIQFNIFLVILTILIPVFLVGFDVDINLSIVPIFIIIYVLFRFLNNNVHKVYLEEEDKKLAKEIRIEGKKERGNTRKTIFYVVCLIFTGIILFVIGDALGNTLQNLAMIFGVSEFVIGTLLGGITSIPELITFIEAQKHYENKNEMLGVVEATNNLLISNILNLFVIQSVGVILAEIYIR